MRKLRRRINKFLPIVMLVATMACMGSVAMAQQNAPDPNQPDPNNPDPQQQGGVHVIGGGGPVIITTVGGPGGGGGAMRGQFRLGGGPMMMGGQLEQFIGMLGQINLKTDFTLTADQKSKVQAIRDDFKKQSDEWKQQHADEIKQLEEQQAEMMQGFQTGNIPDPGQMQEMEEQRRALYETAPNGEDHVAQIKALFSPEQDKIFETHRAQIENERAEIFQRMGGGRIIMGGPGVPPAPPAPPTPPSPPADPNEKKK